MEKMEKSEKSEKSEKVSDKDNDIKEYIEQMNPLQKIAYEIAKSQLKSSFCIEHSIGFIKYKSLKL